MIKTDAIPEPVPADTRPPIPEFRDTYAIQTWHWQPASQFCGAYWLPVVHTETTLEKANMTMQMLREKGNRVVGIVRIPGVKQ